MLATSQEQIEMRMTLANAEARGVQMNAQLKKIDDIVDKTDKLLYQMIPQVVAEKLRKGADPIDTVEVFESVTMLFSGINTIFLLLIFLLSKNENSSFCTKNSNILPNYYSVVLGFFSRGLGYWKFGIGSFFVHRGGCKGPDGCRWSCYNCV